MHFYNDSNGDNMFTLAIKTKNIKIIIEVMKYLCRLSIDKLNAAAGLISLKDIIKQNNVHVEPLIKDAMVPVLYYMDLEP